MTEKTENKSPQPENTAARAAPGADDGSDEFNKNRRVSPSVTAWKSVQYFFGVGIGVALVLFVMNQYVVPYPSNVTEDTFTPVSTVAQAVIRENDKPTEVRKHVFTEEQMSASANYNGGIKKYLGQGVTFNIIYVSLFFFDKTVPGDAVKLYVKEADHQTCAWLLDGHIFLRTAKALISPQPLAEGGQDGTRVYMIDAIDHVVLYSEGHEVKVSIEFAANAPSDAPAEADVNK